MAKSRHTIWAAWTTPRRETASESGFTLIELLIVVLLVPIVIGGVAVALITVFKDQAGVQNRISDSHDAQLTSTYFVRDVQGATQFETNSTALCVQTSAAHTSYTQVLGLEWPSTTLPPPAVASVSYVYESGGTAPPILVRWYCSGATTTPSTVAHGLTGTPTVCVRTSSGCITSSSLEPLLTAGVTVINISVPDTTSGFSYNQLAAPRIVSSSSAGPPPPNKFNIILLGGGSCPILTLKNVATLNVGSGSSGSIAINSGCSTAVKQDNNSNLGARSIQTQSTTGLQQNCTRCTPSNYSATANYSPDKVPDPYSTAPGALIAPSKPAISGICTPGVGNTVACTAGYYSPSAVPPNCPSFANNGVTVTFAAGTSYFDNCTLSLPNNVNFTATGVLFYFTNGASMQVGNSPSINMTAATTPGGPGCLASASAYYATYPCVALWQASSDATAWTWGGGSQSGSVSVAGSGPLVTSPGGVQGSAVYLPGAAFTISNVQNLTITQVVLQSMVIDNVGTTQIG